MGKFLLCLDVESTQLKQLKFTSRFYTFVITSTMQKWCFVGVTHVCLSSCGFCKDSGRAAPRFLWATIRPLNQNKRLANAKRPCDCSVLCRRPKSSLCNCPHSMLDMTLFARSVRYRDEGRDSVQQWGRSVNFKPIFQVEENTFRPIFFGYFIADWLFYNFASERFHTTKVCSRLYSTEIEFYSEKLKNRVFYHPLGGLRGNVRTPSIARSKAVVDFLFAIIEFFRYLLRLRRYKRRSVDVGVFRRGWVTLSANFRRKGHMLVPENLSDCSFVRYPNVLSASFSFVTIHASYRIATAIPCVALHAATR